VLWRLTEIQPAEEHECAVHLATEETPFLRAHAPMATKHLLSAYERARQQNIERNRLQLAQLGLVSLRTTKVAAAKRKRATLSQRPAEHAVRRSARLRDRPGPHVDYRELPAADRSSARRRADATTSQRRNWQVSPVAVASRASDEEGASPAGASVSHARRQTSRSSREIAVELRQLREGWLGKQFACTGKQVVVESAVAHRRVVRFSKLQGHLLWENAVFLWTNLAQPNNPYHNPFTVHALDNPTTTTLEHWRQLPPAERNSHLLSMTWYASAQSSAESPVLRRLLARDAQVHLFCRLLPTEPYIYFGRLLLQATDLEKRPFAFRYLLADSEALMSEPSAAVPAILQLAQDAGTSQS
jgi:hypothetical protein